MSPRAATESVAERIVQSVFLTALARVVMTIGTPIIGAAMIWAVSEVVALRRDVAVIQADRASVRAEITRRLDEIERRNTREAESTERMTTRLSAIESTLAGVAATQAAIQRGLDRIERVVEARGARP